MLRDMARSVDALLQLLLKPEFNPADSLSVSGINIAFLNDGASEALFHQLTDAMEPDEPDHDSDYYESWGESWEKIGQSLSEHYVFGNDVGDFWVFDEPDWRFHWLIHVTRPEIIDAAFFKNLNAAMRANGNPEFVVSLLIDHPTPVEQFTMYLVDGAAVCDLARADFVGNPSSRRTSLADGVCFASWRRTMSQRRRRRSRPERT